MLSSYYFIIYFIYILMVRAQFPCFYPRTIIVSGSYDNTLKIWDFAEQSQCLMTLKGHSDWVKEISISKDFQYIFSASLDKSIIMWDLKTGILVKTLLGHTSGVMTVDVSPDGKKIASGEKEKTLLIWNISDFTILKTITTTNQVIKLKFSPDGKNLFCSEFRGILEVFDVETGVQKLKIFAHTADINDMLFTFDNNYLLTCSSDSMINMFDLNNNLSFVKEFKGHDASVESIIVDSKNSILVSAGWDLKIIVWDLITGGVISNFKSSAAILSLKLISDNKILITGDSNYIIKFLDISTGNIVQSYSNYHINIVKDLKIAFWCLKKNPKTSDSESCNCTNQLSLSTNILNKCQKIDVSICQGCPCQGYMLESTCQTDCLTPYWGDNISGNCLKTCPKAFYGDLVSRVCTACDISCESCSGVGNSQCLTCNFPSEKPFHESPNIGVEGLCLAKCTDPNPFGDDTSRRCQNICNNPNWGLLATNKCVADCPQGYFKNESIRRCEPCDKTCFTCSAGGVSNCLECTFPGPTPYHEFPSLQVNGRCLSKCIEPYPYSHDGSAKCYSKCPTPTWGNPATNKCDVSCEENYYYYDANRECKKCHSTCKTCAGELETDCLSCGGAIKRYHEFDTPSIIGKCLTICSTLRPYADDTSNRCYASCPFPSWGITTSGKCETLCPSILFYKKIETRECKKCHPTCETCSAENPSDCLSCISGGEKPYHESSCIDENGMCLDKCVEPNPYADDSTNRCYKTCPENLWGLSTTGKCEKICPSDHYQDIQQKICKKCDLDCASCSANGSNNCLTCILGGIKPYHEFPNIGKNGLCLANCLAEYPYADDASKRCYKICPELLWGFPKTGKCESTCQIDYYKNFQQKTCLKCHSDCLSCSAEGSQNCLVCLLGGPKPYHESPNAGENGSCLAKCVAPNPYADDTTNRCYSKCPGQLLGLPTIGKCVKTCPFDYYPDSQQNLCLKCNPDCATCSAGDSKNCLSCSSNSSKLYHESPELGKVGSCLTKCDSPYPYADDFSNRCYIKCPEPLWGYKEKCEKNCPSDYFKDNFQKICVQCPLFCTTCLDSMNCLTCLNGFYIDNKNCRICPLECEECKELGECLKCNIGYVLDGKVCRKTCSGVNYANWAERICTDCKNDQYNSNNGGEIKCLSCQSPCRSCKNTPNNCTSCVEGLYWTGTECLDHCVDGKYPIQEFGLCGSCNSSCKTCNSKGCTSCPENRFLYEGTCVSKCPEHFFSNMTSNSCEICHFTCLECEGSSKKDCLNCPASRFLDQIILSFDKQQYLGECNCKSGTFEKEEKNCGKCHFSCANCTDEGYLACSVCVGNRGDKNQVPFQGRCTCPENTYDFLEDICKDGSEHSLTITTINIQKETVKYTTVTSIFSFGLLRSLGTLFNFIDVAQEINLYSFLNIDYPLNLESFLTFLANFRFFKNFKFFEIEKFTPLTEANIYQFPKTFSLRGVSNYFLKNSLSTLIIIISVPMLYFLLMKIIGFLIKKKKINSLKPSYWGNIVISLWKTRNQTLSQVFFSLILGCLQELHLFAIFQIITFKGFSIFEKVSFSISILWVLFELIVSLYVIYAYLKTNPQIIPFRLKVLLDKLSKSFSKGISSSETREIYPFLFSPLLRDDKFGMTFIIFKITKKILLPTIYALFSADIEFATTILLFTYSASYLYTRTIQPFKYNFFNIVNEIVELGHICFLGCLKFYTRAVSLNNSELALGLGLYMIYSVIFIMMANTIFIIISFLVIAKGKVDGFLKADRKKASFKILKQEKDSNFGKILELQCLEKSSPVNKELEKPQSSESNKELENYLNKNTENNVNFGGFITAKITKRNTKNISKNSEIQEGIPVFRSISLDPEIRENEFLKPDSDPKLQNRQPFEKLLINDTRALRDRNSFFYEEDTKRKEVSTPCEESSCDSNQSDDFAKKYNEMVNNVNKISEKFKHGAIS